MLRRDEGEVLVVYDDANGKPVGPGSTLIGHPTVGIGRALDTEGLTKAESAWLFANDVEVVQARAQQAFFWYPPLTTERKAVVLSMLFQLGLAGVQGFHDFCVAMGVGDWHTASLAMLDSKWAKHDSPSRAERLARQLSTGEYQP